MSPEFINFLAFCTIWCPIGWIGMMIIGFYRWFYQYKSISLHEILGWGIIVGAMSGPTVFIFIVVMALMEIKWDMTVIKARPMSDQTRQRLYERSGRY